MFLLFRNKNSGFSLGHNRKKEVCQMLSDMKKINKAKTNNTIETKQQTKSRLHLAMHPGLVENYPRLGALPDEKAFYITYRETFGMFGLSTVKTHI